MHRTVARRLASVHSIRARFSSIVLSDPAEFEIRGRRMHRRGERREYFESLGDVWEMFSLIAAERKRREMDPVLETIRQCRQMLDEASLGKAAAKREDVQATRQRLAGMEEFMAVTNKIFQQFIGNARSGLTRVVKVLLKAF